MLRHGMAVGHICAVVVLSWLGVEGSGNVQQPCGFGESEVSIIASARSGIVAWVTGLTWAILGEAQFSEKPKPNHAQTHLRLTTENVSTTNNFQLALRAAPPPVDDDEL